MNSKALLPLQTDPINCNARELRIFSQLRISDRFRGCQHGGFDEFRRDVKCSERCG